MLPNFLIIGAQKAATTFLARRLEEHPNVYLAAQKEIHYFNHKFEKESLDWYEAHFSDWSGQQVTGEATPGYLNHPDAPARIKSTLPGDVKFIASLRHPVDRAYSAFWHYMIRGRIAEGTDFQTFFMGSDEFGLRSRGYYFSHLNNYFGCFPRQNFLVLIYEQDLKRNSETALQTCLEFLEVDPDLAPQVAGRAANQGRDMKKYQSQALALRRAVVKKTRQLPNGVRAPVMGFGKRVLDQVLLKRLPKQDEYEPLAEAVRRELLEPYMPEIKSLENLLDRDLSVWYA
jgi:hypothetical protein